MSWKKGRSGERVYVASIYDKDCLPTWDEIYNKFYKQQMFRYDPNNSDHKLSLDAYWNRPYRKMILGWMCNQLNKLIFEDGIDAVQFLRNKHGVPFHRVYFVLAEEDPSQEDAIFMDNMDHYFQLETAPEIYSCKIPSTNEYSVFSSEHPHVNIDELDGPIRIIALTSNKMGISMGSTEQFWELVTFVLKDVINYFENGIGWKDDDGKVIPSDQCCKKCEGAGFDPAL
jgi:hypothetical protein